MSIAVSFKRCLIVGVPLLMLAQAADACTASATSHQFGMINPLDRTATSSVSSITISCPSTTSYSISLSAGAGTYAERLMHSGSDALSYNLYSDSNHQTIWGDGTGGSAVVNGSADSGGTSHSVYGNVPSQPQAVPGSYSDSIVVTVTF